MLIVLAEHPPQGHGHRGQRENCGHLAAARVATSPRFLRLAGGPGTAVHWITCPPRPHHGFPNRFGGSLRTCGLRPRASYGSTRVVGGTDAQPGAWPWIVSVQELWEQGAAHKCGGSLISSQWVLTAAHCFVTVRTDAMWRVVAGTTQLSRLGPEAQVRHVRRVLSHKYYDYGTQENDIALVELDHPIQCNDYIQLACVADTTVRVSELTSCYVSGWGSTSARNAKASDVLQEAQVHLIDLQLCNSTWWYGGAIHSHNVCAGYPQGGIDTCQGDSGGPLVCKDNNAEYFWLVGVTSWGEGCARPFQPGVYTSTQHFYDWILVQMGLHHEVTSAPTPQHFVTSAPPQTQRPTQGTFKPCPYPENKLVEFFKKLQKLLQSLKKKTA
ncbi:acrosin [Columba livia]|uniref:Acrosin n=1 Tax=Columba livia TaxID=8932 RepID=A0A2I0LMN5_COLLI|nr:acrosin [Columba livia]